MGDLYMKLVSLAVSFLAFAQVSHAGMSQDLSGTTKTSVFSTIVATIAPSTLVYCVVPLDASAGVEDDNGQTKHQKICGQGSAIEVFGLIMLGVDYAVSGATIVPLATTGAVVTTLVGPLKDETIKVANQVIAQYDQTKVMDPMLAQAYEWAAQRNPSLSQEDAVANLRLALASAE